MELETPDTTIDQHFLSQGEQILIPTNLLRNGRLASGPHKDEFANRERDVFTFEVKRAGDGV